MAMVHIGGRSYQLEATALDPLLELAKEIEDAVAAGSSVTIPVVVEGGKINLYVNTKLVDIIAFDWDGKGAGFFHG